MNLTNTGTLDTVLTALQATSTREQHKTRLGYDADDFSLVPRSVIREAMPPLPNTSLFRLFLLGSVTVPSRVPLHLLVP
jgi:hypothetical protein